MDLFTCLLGFESSLLHLHVSLFIFNFSPVFCISVLYLHFSLLILYFSLLVWHWFLCFCIFFLSYLCNLFSHFQFILIFLAPPIRSTRFSHSCLRLFNSIYNLCTPQISYFLIKFMPIFLVSVLTVYFNEWQTPWEHTAAVGKTKHGRPVICIAVECSYYPYHRAYEWEQPIEKQQTEKIKKNQVMSNNLTVAIKIDEFIDRIKMVIFFINIGYVWTCFS